MSLNELIGRFNSVEFNDPLLHSINFLLFIFIMFRFVIRLLEKLRVLEQL